MVKTEDILNKYGARIEREMKGAPEPNIKQFSSSYVKFRQEMTPTFTAYEKWCKVLGNIFKVNVSQKDKIKLEKNISIAHLDLTSSEVFVFSIVVLFLSFFGGLLFFVALYWLTNSFSFMFLFLVLLVSMFLFYFSYTMPQRLALQWRLKASSQMVPAILYIIIYMKHTSNLEKAIAFAAEHLQPPLSMDFRKIFWDVEVGKFSKIKDSIDNYLLTWRDYSVEFVESFHLIESSLYEPAEQRRVEILEKALQVILDGVYDKMLKYTHDVKSPLTNIYMLGIVLPTLSLAILPLASTMLQGAIQWYHILLIYNLIIPFFVFYLTENVIVSRPGGYGESSLLELNPLYYKYKSTKPYWIAFLVSFPLFLIGLIPFLLRYTDLNLIFGFQRDYTWSQLGLGFLGNSGIFGIVENNGVIAGPFGAVSLILSLFIPLSIAVMFIVAFDLRTKELIKEREKSKEVEQEFVSSLFQLGNRIGDGLPAEIAFAKVAESTKGTSTEGFFKIVNQNIQQLGMSLNEALFNPKRGAIVFYPSEIIVTSMRILIESVKKGLNVAARSLMSISEYVKNIKKINDRLNDLLADIISDMKSNMVFLAPLLSGIVVGLSGMIAAILSNLAETFKSGALAGQTDELTGTGGIEGLLSLFDINVMIPTYWLQIVIGLYLIEIVFILTMTLVAIKSGRDNLQTTSEIGKNLKTAMIFYVVVSLAATIGLFLLGSVALKGLVG
ncbi:MAG: hypothetical protein Q7S33_05885 [Nanoarchaeota archaeon]|nr:hypothetical protein [Nanoarchaeota archaeon]